MKHVFKVQLVFPRIVLTAQEGSLQERANDMINGLLEYELINDQRPMADYIVRDEHDNQFAIDVLLTFNVTVEGGHIRDHAKALVPDEVERLISENGLNHVSHEVVVYDTFYKR